MLTCSMRVVSKSDIVQNVTNRGVRISTAASLAMLVFVGAGAATQIMLPTSVAAQERLTIEQLYNSSESFDRIIGNARIKRVKRGTGMHLSGVAPFYSNDDWFRSYDDPSMRVKAKKALKSQADFDFMEFDKYLKSNRKDLYRIYFYQEEGFIALQFINDDYVDNIIIRLQPSIVKAFVN